MVANQTSLGNDGPPRMNTDSNLSAYENSLGTDPRFIMVIKIDGLPSSFVLHIIWFFRVASRLFEVRVS